jgi:branched-chain amino acid transport system permease protein
VAQCRFWSVSNASWLADGCVTVARPAGAPARTLYCACDHLTAFAGVLVPAGVLAAPILSVEPGMGDNLLILAFVVIVIGGIGSIKGAFVGALIVGLTDTLGGIFLPELFKLVMDPSRATSLGAALSSMAIYVLMAVVLIWRPTGLFGARA